MSFKKISLTLFAAAMAASIGAAAPVKAADKVVKLWSHWADHDTKRAFVEGAAREFESKNPGVKIEVNWYDKNALYAALKTALRAGQAPDIFYAEPDQVEYLDNNMLYDLSKGLNWSNVEPWAKDVWSYKGGVYGFPLEAWTVELYYNQKMLSDLGYKLPPSGQFDQATFLKLVKDAKAKDITPIANGVGDRPYPGAFLTSEALVKMLGLKDYDGLLRGTVPWSDPRVVKALEYVKQLIDAGALPPTFANLKLGESHFYFHTKPGSLMFQTGSFYPSRAFNPVDKGGQPENFPLGMMKYPSLEGAACNECKTITVGGSYVVNAASKNPDVAVAYLNTMATPERGNQWMEVTLVQTGIKTDPGKIGGPYAPYFKALGDINRDAKYYLNLPSGVLNAKSKEVFSQVVNKAFPAGLLGVKDVVDQMTASYK